MAEELKGLIEKINEEGVKAAEEKARHIEEAARKRADEIMRKAEKEAERLIADGKERIARVEESANSSLKQAGRDLLLSLRREINSMLEKLIVSHVRKALTPDELARIIKELVKHHKTKEKGEVVISLKKEDIEKLEKGFFDEMREDIKKGIVIKPSDEIKGGFIISYDSGRSYYDFTDKALADYISSYLKPNLSNILKE